MQFKITRFQKLTSTYQPSTINHQPTVGLGDLVARMAKPIARRIDRLLGTDLANCEACEERRRWLNKLMGDG